MRITSGSKPTCHAGNTRRQRHHLKRRPIDKLATRIGVNGEAHRRRKQKTDSPPLRAGAALYLYHTTAPQQFAVQGVVVAVQVSVEVLTLMTCCVRFPFAS